MYQDAIDANNKRVNENKEYYKRRQQIIEHPYGTVKRSWGYSYTLLKSLSKVNGEMGIILTMYNFRRAITLLGGADKMLVRLKAWKPDLLSAGHFLKLLTGRQNLKIKLAA